MEREIRWYTVTQERKVRVEAQDPLSAAHIAQLAFDGREADAPGGGVGRTTSTLRTTDLVIREDY